MSHDARPEYHRRCRRDTGRLLAVVVTMVLVAAVDALAATGAVASSDDAGSDEVEEIDFSDVEPTIQQEVIEFINRERVEAGLDPLEVWDDDSMAHRANDDYLAIDGEEAHRLVPELGPDYQAQGARWFGENQYMRVRGPSGRVVQGWRESDGHNRNMLTPEATHVAVATTCEARDIHPSAIWATAHVIIATPGDGPAPVAEHAAAEDVGTACDDAAALDEEDSEQGPASDAEAVRLDDLLRPYATEIGIGLAALFILGSVRGRHRRRRQERRDRQRRQELAAQNETRIEFVDRGGAWPT